MVNYRRSSKLGCVVRMVVDSILPHTECGPNDHRKDAPPLTGKFIHDQAQDSISKKNHRMTVVDKISSFLRMIFLMSVREGKSFIFERF